MSVILRINGEVWEFSTAAEAAEFRQSLTVVSPALQEPQRANVPGPQAAIRGGARGPRRSAGRVPVLSRSALARLSDSSRALLEAVQRLPRNGVPSSEFAQLIGVEGPEKVPMQMMRLGKELKRLEIKTDDVVKRTKTYSKGKATSVFSPGYRLNEVLGRAGELFAMTE